MAITIRRRAPLHAFAFNPVWWVVESTNVAQDNFRYVMDIYISNFTFAGQSYLRIKKPADPDEGMGVFNAHTVLERCFDPPGFDIAIASAGSEAVLPANHSVLEYVVKFGEEYGPSSAVVVTPDLATAGFNYVYNGVLDHLDHITFISTSGSAYLNANTVFKRFHTNVPHSETSTPPHVKVRANERRWLQIINNNAFNNSARVHYEALDSNFSTLSTVVVRNNYSGLSTVGSHKVIVPAGYNIDDIATADIISGSLPIISPLTTKFWLIYMMDTSNNQVSEGIVFKKDSSCTMHTEFVLHFLNEFGAFDTFTFYKAHEFETDIKERKKYSKPLGKFIAENNFMYEASDLHDVIFYTELKDGITLNSDWIDEATSRWLEELVASPVVMIETVRWSSATTPFYLVGVTITDKKYERKQRGTDRLFNLKIKVQPTYNRYRQRF